LQFHSWNTHFKTDQYHVDHTIVFRGWYSRHSNL